jgi:hexosaminidase
VPLHSVIPAPAHVERAPGGPFRLSPGVAIAAPCSVANVAARLAELIGGRVAADGEAAAIVLELERGPGLGGEGYRLDAGGAGIRLRATTPEGLFRGAHTLAQLAAGGDVPALAIRDAPRFAWRGAMLDVARHFRPVAEVQRFLDLMADHKLNVLHLHLTDDQGWRIAIGSWPRLATGPGGAYSHADYAAIVAHAAERFVTVVPEVDVPGHTHAALVAYPELAADGVPRAPYAGTAVGFSSLRTDLELTYRFLDDVVRELAAMTPGPYVHLGGDEASSTSQDGYASFMARAHAVVAAHGKRMVAWEQVAGAPLQAGAVVQHWNTPALARAAVRQGARVVMSPAGHAYLDQKYDASTTLGQDWAGHVEVRDAYDWEPATLIPGIGEDDVLGVEAALWSETLATLADIDYMALPRLPALAEVGWSPRSARGWDGFSERLAAHAPRWRAAGARFHRSPQVRWGA